MGIRVIPLALIAMLVGCSTESPSKVQTTEPANDHAAVSFPAPPKVPDVQQ